MHENSGLQYTRNAQYYPDIRTYTPYGNESIDQPGEEVQQRSVKSAPTLALCHEN